MAQRRLEIVEEFGLYRLKNADGLYQAGSTLEAVLVAASGIGDGQVGSNHEMAELLDGVLGKKKPESDGPAATEAR